MRGYVALLRGVNVGGNNMINMADLKKAFERRGFHSVVTYINSGNILFFGGPDEAAVSAECADILTADFGMDVAVCVIPAAELADSLARAPGWWNAAPDAKHDAFFVIPPATAAGICGHVGEAKEDYEKAAYHGRVIFWSAPVATYSRTRWSKLSKDKSMYRAITVRNANTALKLAELAAKY